MPYATAVTRHRHIDSVQDVISALCIKSIHVIQQQNRRAMHHILDGRIDIVIGRCKYSHLIVPRIVSMSSVGNLNDSDTLGRSLVNEPD